MNLIKEIEDTILVIDIEVSNTKDITSKASLIASKVELLKLLKDLNSAGKKSETNLKQK